MERRPDLDRTVVLVPVVVDGVGDQREGLAVVLEATEDEGTFDLGVGEGHERSAHAAHGLGPRAVRRELSRSTEENNTPHRISEGQLWGQFESVYPLRVTEWAAKAPNLDPDFRALFDGLPSFFDRDDIDGSFD